MTATCAHIYCRESGADNWSPGNAWMGSPFRIVPLLSCPFIHVPLCLSGTGLCYEKKKAALPGDADGQLPAPIRRRGKRLPVGDSHVSHVMLISRTDMHCVQD